MSMHEINAAAETITSAVDPDANIIFGATLDESMGDEIMITVIATGFDPNYYTNRHTVHAPMAETEDVANTIASEPEEHEKSKELEPIREHEPEPEKEPEPEVTTPNDGAHEFHSEMDHSDNIWTHDTDDDDRFDKPSFLRFRRKKKDKNAE